MIQKLSKIQDSFEPIREGKVYKQWIFAILLNMTVFNYGLQVGWPSAVSEALQAETSPIGYPLSTFDISLIASAPNLSAMLSIPLWTFLVDKYGRKLCLIVSNVLLAISWLIVVFCSSFTILMSSRIIAGLAAGGCVFISPMYTKELSQDSIRGILAMVWNVARSIGILSMFVIGGYLEYFTILWVVLTVSVASFLAVLISPESPTYYYKVGKFDIAARTIASLRCLDVHEKSVQNTMDSIKAEDDKFKSIPNITFFGIFHQKAWRKGFIFMFLVMLCHGLCGGYAIANYAPIIIKMFGVTVNPELQSISIPIFMIIGCSFSMVLVEHLGRRALLAMCFFLCSLAFISLAAIVIIQQNGGYVPGWVAVLVTVTTVFVYSAAVSPVPFVVMAEMFNFQIRAKIMGCLGMVGWGGAFVQVLIFGPMTAAFGAHVTFCFYAIINFCGVVVVLVLLPETKKKSVAEIERELK